MILDGLGDSIDGTVDEISNFLYERLTAHGQKEVIFLISLDNCCMVVNNSDIDSLSSIFHQQFIIFEEKLSSCFFSLNNV